MGGVQHSSTLCKGVKDVQRRSQAFFAVRLRFRLSAEAGKELPIRYNGTGHARHLGSCTEFWDRCPTFVVVSG